MERQNSGRGALMKTPRATSMIDPGLTSGGQQRIQSTRNNNEKRMSVPFSGVASQSMAIPGAAANAQDNRRTMTQGASARLLD